ncbi:Cell Wall Hydrolase [Onishia taeanensis]|uniref:Cell Wall Hydrolase n=1 Tax=Onishia taeanensis TaxID=284577 RepID=A0A1G7RL44_9GAMM|nr:cell wall hydrolase [Halomonas taeanensis]SDG10770.1 Cell Wall Hydrolase [Halomonas taeanensis]
MYQSLVAFCLAVLMLADPVMAADSASLTREEKSALAQEKAELIEQSIVEGGSDSRPEPDVAITRPGILAVDPLGAAPLDDAITCLSRAVYWEAKGEGTDDMAAVANVVMNRLAAPGFPDSICGVVKQGGEQGYCQFSWWCDGRGDDVNEPQRYAIVKEVARKALNGQLPDGTDGALFFHQRTISPYWAAEFTETARVGDFIFYKP